MITFNVIDRIFAIKYGDAIGTCFTIDVDKKQYIVTARHVVNKIKDNEKIYICHENTWKPITIRLVGHAEGTIDVSVISINSLLSPNYPLDPSMDNLSYGQDVYFLGFPYGFSANYGEFSRNLPIPFVKKAIVSCVINNDGIIEIYLDGHNNPGFSGGPVVFKEQNKRDFKVAGIISGYFPEDKPIYQNNQELPLTYKYNTGIIIAFSIKHAIDLITKNPVGLKTND